MKVHLIEAHPEPTSLTRHLGRVSRTVLQASGHEIITSELYGMRWKAVLDADDFPQRVDSERFDVMAESSHAFASGTQTTDVADEQQKLLNADAAILHFPLWWFSAPAILKGWIDRVFARGLAYDYRNAGNRYRYGEGGLQGKRGLLCVCVGGPEADYGPRGINGPLEQLMFPLTHGTLFFAGMQVLPTFAVYDCARASEASVTAATRAWEARLTRLFDDAPIAFRRQNSGDYPDGHTLAMNIAPERDGITAHLRFPR